VFEKRAIFLGVWLDHSLTNDLTESKDLLLFRKGPLFGSDPSTDGASAS